MRELTYLGRRRVEWRSVASPTLQGPKEALVRPVLASRCDGDVLPVFNRLTTAMRLGVAVHYLDPVTTDLLGRAPYAGPFPIGHECIAVVADCGDEVRQISRGDLVIVPWSVSCGGCMRCDAGLTSKCLNAGGTTLAGYGFGRAMGPWGGMVCDLLRVPFADAMLVPVPAGTDPLLLASASDNLCDAWRTVGPLLEREPGAPVLVGGGGARSIGLYAAGIAVALGAGLVEYRDHDPERLAIAERLGASVVERPLRALRGTSRSDFAISVDASSTAQGLREAVVSTRPGGTCTAVGFYFARRTGLPLMRMYATDVTLRVGVSHPRRDLPSVIELVRSKRFDPRPVTTLLADWNDAPDAFMTRTTKVVVQRANELPTASLDA